MAEREKKEKDQRDPALYQIDFKGLTQEEALGQDGLVKQLAGRLLRRLLESERWTGIRGTRSAATQGIILGTAGTGTAGRPFPPRTMR
jgi:hypothetical protein